MNKLTIKSAIAVGVSALILSSATQVFAVDTATTAGDLRKTALTANQTANQTAKIDQLKAKAIKEIDRRLTTLNNLLTRVSSSTKLSAAAKASLQTQIQSEITNLTALKAKISTDTDLATLRTDVKSIVSSYRVYLLVVPQVSLVNTADSLLRLIDLMTNISAKLAMGITEAQTAGINVTAAQTSLTDLNQKLAEAKKLAEGVETAALQLTPEGYPANKTTLTSGRSQLVKARDLLKTARKDVENIRRVLRGNNGSKTATSSATPTASGSALTR